MVKIKIVVYSFLFCLLFAENLLVSAGISKSAGVYKKMNLPIDDTVKVHRLIHTARNLLKQNLLSSANYAEEAIVLSKILNYKTGIADGLTITGQVEFHKGNYPLALDLLLKASTIYLETNNKKGSGNVYNSLGKVYQYQTPDNFDIASKYFGSALKLNTQTRNNEGIIISYSYIADLFADKINERHFNPDSALIYYNKALTLAKEINDSFYTANIYSSIGKTYSELNNFSASFEYLFKALLLQEKINDFKGIIHTNYRLGTVYSKIKNYKLALDYELKALKAAEEHRSLDLMNNICEDISELYFLTNDYKKSLHFYKKAVELKFQLYSQERIAKIAEYQTKYETVKKEKEIILLNKDKEIQRVELQKKESELKKQQVIQFAFITGFFLVFVLAVVAYRGYQNKKTANLLLAKQKIEILDKNRQLLQQTEEITSQRDEIEKKNITLKQTYDIIEHKSNKITSSINYALKIQQSVLPTDENWHQIFPESFVLYLPKDIVSGDFYWLNKREKNINFAAVDCTGHGVPGAFMSMIAHNLLDQVLNELHPTNPSEILKLLNNKLREKLHTNPEIDTLRDGMDIALCCYNKEQNILEYAGVHHPLYIIRRKELIVYQPDNFNMGNSFSELFNAFTNHIIKLEKEDVIYLFTDGYYDQFDVKNQKKFTRKKFNETLLNFSDYSFDEQKKQLLQTFYTWKGDNEQVDDILIIGIKV